MKDEKNIHDSNKTENKHREMQIYVKISIHLGDCFVITGP